jgi:hypothetical protein
MSARGNVKTRSLWVVCSVNSCKYWYSSLKINLPLTYSGAESPQQCDITSLFFLTFMELCIIRCISFYIPNEMQLIQCSLLLSVLYMFRAVFPPIIRSFKNCMCSLRYCHAFVLSTAGVVGAQPQPHQR